jgi:hypothetical protein
MPNKLAGKNGRYVELCNAIVPQSKFEFFLIYNKAALENSKKICLVEQQPS